MTFFAAVISSSHSYRVCLALNLWAAVSALGPPTKYSNSVVEVLSSFIIYTCYDTMMFCAVLHYSGQKANLQGDIRVGASRCSGQLWPTAQGGLLGVLNDVVRAPLDRHILAPAGVGGCLFLTPFVSVSGPVSSAHRPHLLFGSGPLLPGHYCVSMMCPCP